MMAEEKLLSPSRVCNGPPVREGMPKPPLAKLPDGPPLRIPQ